MSYKIDLQICRYVFKIKEKVKINRKLKTFSLEINNG